MNEIIKVSENYLCIYCGKKMMYINNDSLKEVYCDCSEWNQNYIK